MSSSSTPLAPRPPPLACRLQKHVPALADQSGSTAIVCMLSDSSVVTAGVGDSRAVLGRRADVSKSDQASFKAGWVAHDLSRDHKVTEPSERARLEAAGGVVEVEPDGETAHVWKGEIGQGCGLGMARSIGDHAMGRSLIINTPDVTETPLTQDDAVLILASDGVWDFISSQAAVDIAFHHRKCGAREACKALIKAAAKAWQEVEKTYRDDITAIVVFLPALKAAEQHTALSSIANQTMAGGGQLPPPQSIVAQKHSIILSDDRAHELEDARNPPDRTKTRLSVNYGVPEDAMDGLELYRQNLGNSAAPTGHTGVYAPEHPAGFYPAL